MTKIPIFFDLGGTIVDNIEIFMKAMNELFDKNLSLPEVKSMYIDMSQKVTLKSLFRMPINPIKLLVKRKDMSQLQNQYLLSEGMLFEGAREFLLKLKSKENILLIIVTQNPQFKDKEFTKTLFTKLFGGEHPFDYIFSSRNKANIIKENFDRETLSKSIYVGDLPNDMKMAKELQIPGIGVAWGYADGKLETPYIVNSFDELFDFIENHLNSFI